MYNLGTILLLDLKKYLKYLNTEVNVETAKRKLLLIICSVLSAFVFLNFFEPFGLYYDNSISNQDVFVELLIAMITVFVVLTTSQFVLRVLFKLNKFTIISLFLWFLFEAVLVASAWFVLEILDKNFTDKNLTHWFENLFAYILIIFFPYFSFIIIINIKDAIKKLTPKNITTKIIEDISFRDEGGIVRLVLKTENVIFIQSADNYIEINYIENNDVSKFLIRNSIKKIESNLNNTPIIRCHRSYIVNTKKIETAKKTSSGFNLHLKQAPNKIIPVSKTYISEFQKIFKKTLTS